MLATAYGRTSYESMIFSQHIFVWTFLLYNQKCLNLKNGGIFPLEGINWGEGINTFRQSLRPWRCKSV